MRVFINPGHAYDGNPDPGACNYNLNLRECDIALAVGEKVKYYLEKVGYEVCLLQSDNLAGESPCYQNVTDMANELGADIFVSIHCNAANGIARGVETLCYSLQGQGAKLARCIQNQLVDTLQVLDDNFPDRGIKQDVRGLAVLKYTNMPAVLTELAFIDQYDDAQLLMNYQDDIARAIARGITDYAA